LRDKSGLGVEDDTADASEAAPGHTLDAWDIGALTTNADTATANVFNGNVQIVGNFALNTLNNGDRLTGSGTNPTLNLTYAEIG
jgi:hypothetical protein